MKPTSRRKTILWSIIALIGILMIVGIGYGYHLTQEHSREWNYWKELPLSVKLMGPELELERLFHRVFPPDIAPERYPHVSANALEDSMRLGADWLLAMQEPKGRFKYWYDPVKDEFSTRFNDNFLRQAGTSYSLSLVYEMTGEERYLNSARKSLE
jgi:hypothetical protein